MNHNIKEEITVNYEKFNSQLKEIRNYFNEETNKVYDEVWQNVIIPFCRKYKWEFNCCMGLFSFHKIYINSDGTTQKIDYLNYLDIFYDLYEFGEDGNESYILTNRKNSEEFKELKELVEFLDQDPAESGLNIGFHMGMFNPDEDPGCNVPR